MKFALPVLSFACALSLPLQAGTSAKEVIAHEDPCLATWFAGASVGELSEFGDGETMYNFHFGQDTCYSLAGWDFAWFLEVGFTDTDYRFDFIDRVIDIDISMMPITINGKYEREIIDDLSVYLGAGLGMAEVDFEVSGITGANDDDWVNMAQIFAGISYNITDDWDIYGGGRLMYFEDADINGGNLEIEDDSLLELGFRYNF